MSQGAQRSVQGQERGDSGAKERRGLQGALSPHLAKLGGYGQKPRMGLVQSPGRCLDCSGCGGKCDHSVVFALRASLEGEGTEVSMAVRPRHGAWNTRGAAGRGLSRPTAQSLNMHLK